MKEHDWLSSVDPQAMLLWLTEVSHLHGKASDRKLRLFACACCRHDWEYMTDPRSRRAVKTAERWADGRADDKEVKSARETAWLAYCSEESPCRSCSAVECLRLYTRPWETAVHESWFALSDKPVVQADLLRCIVGNPFRSWQCQCDPEVGLTDCEWCRGRRKWLMWNDGTVVKIARMIYDEHRWDDMPILADALEDAGCGNEDMLQHCRGWQRYPVCLSSEHFRVDEHGHCHECGRWVRAEAGHARGCWVVDLILGKG